MKNRIIIFVVILILLISGVYIWFGEATTAVDPANDAPTIFVIQKGEAIRSIANRLDNAGLIRDPIAFFILVKRRGVEKAIQAGDFRLQPSMTAQEVLDELQHGTIDVWVTIPEGWRSEEIALTLAQKLAIPEQEFLKHAKEGYMFPDTYLFPKEATASQGAELMQRNFQKKITEELAADIAGQNYSLEDIVIIASLVEREAKFTEDRPKIASVILNRLEIGMKLDIDATVQYALGYQADQKTWWKKELTLVDLQHESSYNTYQVNGLPPAPIANPGLASVKAVLHPAETDYLYYLSDEAGVTHYATTFEQHSQNIETYLR